jgi:hypothetical protein
MRSIRVFSGIPAFGDTSAYRTDLQFDGIVAGLESQRQEKERRKGETYGSSASH